MDKKITRRIIGVLMMIALVIIVLPLIISGRATTTLQTTEVKAPPFPEPQNETDPIPASMIVKSSPLKNTVAKDTSVRSAVTAKINPAATPVIAIAKRTPVVSLATPPAKTAPAVLLTNLIAKSNLGLPPSQTGNMIKRAMSQEKAPAIVAVTTTTLVPHIVTATPEAPKPVDTTEPAVVATLSANAADTIKTSEQAFPATPVITTALEAKDEIEKAQRIATDDTATKKPARNIATETVLVVDRQGGIDEVLDGSLQSKVSASTMTIKSKPAAAVVATTSKTTPKPHLKQVAVAKTKKPQIPAAIPANNMSENLSNLKKTAWVVQMGSFKSKDNAVHLTNRLRAKGYKAFTYETKSNGQTRVYVGPEFKQATATILVYRIQKEIDMQGVIVSYNPLAL
jgi:cell division septation protein DedD